MIFNYNVECILTTLNDLYTIHDTLNDLCTIYDTLNDLY